MQNMKLLVVGHVAKDIVKTRAGNGEFWGGAGYHVAMAAAMYLQPDQVVLRSVAGKDCDKASMKTHGVLIDYLVVDGEIDSDRHFLDESGEVRQYYAVGNLSQGIELNGLEKIVGGLGWIHLASSPPEQQLVWLEQIEEYGRNNFIVSCDTFDTFARETPDVVRQVFSKCDLGFLNETEWMAVGGINLKMKLVRKLGRRGVELYEDGRLKLGINAGDAREVKDTTGAGEVFAGVYIAQKMLGKDDKYALMMAAETAGKSVESFGTDHLRF